MKTILLICSCLLLLTSCSEWDTRLVFINNTNDTLRFKFEMKLKNDSIPDLSYCQETNLYYIKPKSDEILRNLNNWNTSFELHPNELLRIYIINNDSLKKYGTCETFKRQIFLKRYDFTYDEFKKINWRIVYDGK